MEVSQIVETQIKKLENMIDSGLINIHQLIFLFNYIENNFSSEKIEDQEENLKFLNSIITTLKDTWITKKEWTDLYLLVKKSSNMIQNIDENSEDESNLI